MKSACYFSQILINVHQFCRIHNGICMQSCTNLCKLLLFHKKHPQIDGKVPPPQHNLRTTCAQNAHLPRTTPMTTKPHGNPSIWGCLFGDILAHAWSGLSTAPPDTIVYSAKICNFPQNTHPQIDGLPWGFVVIDALRGKCASCARVVLGGRYFAIDLGLLFYEKVTICTKLCNFACRYHCGFCKIGEK